MIDFYTWPTPNGRKVSIMLEELGLDYAVRPVDIGKGEQFTPEYQAISPTNKIPAIVDADGPGAEPISLFESGAILIYLAEKMDCAFYPEAPRERLVTLQWLMFQMGNVGPMFGQANHFLKFAKEDVPYGKKRYRDAARRLYGVMDKRLDQVPYLAGEGYTIADIATYPWAARHPYHRVEIAEYPNVERWFGAIGERPAVARGMAVPE